MRARAHGAPLCFAGESVRLIDPPHCVVGGRGAGPDKTQVTGIDHRCCSEAKALSGLCALG